MKKKEDKPVKKAKTTKDNNSYSGRQRKVTKKSEEASGDDLNKESFPKKKAAPKTKEFSDVGFRKNKKKVNAPTASASKGIKKKVKSPPRKVSSQKEVKSVPPDYNIPLKKKGDKTPAENIPGEIRLNRYIANAGVCSRREADTLIQDGSIKVNNKVVTEMGFKVKPDDVVKYENRILKREKFVYVVLNKPRDFITTTDDPEERKTVMDLVKNACDERIYPVGRLDRNTTGLLLLTNDGELAEKLSHPSYNIKKIYQAELNKPLTEEDLEKIQKGVVLEDGPAPVDDIAIVTPDAMVIGIELHLGRNRIVRRIFEHLGYDVLKLDRVSYAGLTKKDLPRGNWRYLTEKEVIQLKHFS